MHINLSEYLSSTRWSISYILLIPILVFIFLVWNGKQRIDDFEKAHHHFAKSTTTILAAELSKQIKSQRRMLSVFAKNESKLLLRLLSSPNNEKLKKQLEHKVAESFPNYFAVSITDSAGTPLYDDFDGLIGEVCLNDLKSHATGKAKPIRVHPNSKAYHIDIIVPLNGSDTHTINSQGELLFVSFKPDFLYRLLALSSTPRHELMLINNEVKSLIEITEKGTRIKLDRKDFRLNTNEQKRILYSTPVSNTSWDLVDFRDETLFSDYKNNIINFSIVILLLFIAGSGLMIIQLLRIERKRINSEKTKEEMFSLFNHDLGAPLNSIFGFLEIYAETDVCEKNPERCKHFANVAFENAVIMRDIISDILDIQKMDASEMSLIVEEVDLIALVKNTIEINYQYALMNKVRLDVKHELESLYVKADARRLTQAITNVLSNAIKYSPENEVVSIYVSRSGDEAILNISDNGPGIDKEFQQFVFDKFAQSKSRLTRNVGGTGLGLTIVKYIVEAHGGYVAFISEKDKGTTFTIGIPCENH